MTLRSPSRAKFWARMLFLVLLSLAVYSVVAAALGWRETFSFGRPDRMRWLLVMGLVWAVAAYEMRPKRHRHGARRRKAKPVSTEASVPSEGTQDGAAHESPAPTTVAAGVATSVDGGPVRQPENADEGLSGDELWRRAREIPHDFVPDPVKDHDYLTLAHAAAAAGVAEAMAKLAEYASRRDAVVEAFYWMTRAKRRGLVGADDFLLQCRDQWLANGCPPEYENEYAFFDVRRGVLARAALRLACGVEVERAQQRLAGMITSGDAEAKELLEEFQKAFGEGAKTP